MLVSSTSGVCVEGLSRREAARRFGIDPRRSEDAGVSSSGRGPNEPELSDRPLVSWLLI
jgi:hypothetical protein